MSLLLETIKIRAGRPVNMEYHNNRVNHTRNKLFGSTEKWDLNRLIPWPDLNPDIIYRCRFLYGNEMEGAEFIPYVRRSIEKLFVVGCGDLEYSFKYADRSGLEKIKTGIPVDPISDILIIKDGLITDTSFSNVVFSDGRHWYTPASPLLPGTKRAYYLDRGVIMTRDIRLSDIHQYTKLTLINAMIDLEEGDDIAIGNIMY
jgi:4-amino-4-deoxychorismate lyase